VIRPAVLLQAVGDADSVSDMGCFSVDMVVMICSFVTKWLGYY
jgi:hypothetical protein